MFRPRSFFSMHPTMTMIIMVMTIASFVQRILTTSVVLMPLPGAFVMCHCVVRHGLLLFPLGSPTVFFFSFFFHSSIVFVGEL